jgi:hypothetical protein
MTAAIDLVTRWVIRQSTEEARGWFVDALQRMPGATEGERRVTLAMAARQVGRDRLALGSADLEAAEHARRGWRPAGLGVAQAARLALLVASHDGNEAAFAARMLALCRAGSLQEVIGYYRGLPIFPGAGALLEVAREGARSAIQPVFDSVALDSPYPAEMFDESGWNQMVLKSLFIGSSPSAIHGLTQRANPRLAVTLVEYAHERWSARRPVSPELWQCVGPFAGAAELVALRRAAESTDASERDAARAALRAVPAPSR